MNGRPLLAALVLAAAPLVAQQPATPRRQMMGDPMVMQEMMGPMMEVMLYTPRHLLARKAALGLTADQVGRLTALRDASETAQDAAMTDAQAHMERLRQAAAATPDTSAVKAHFE